MKSISIIIPYYKKKKYFKHTIKSILAQTFKNFEIIVIYDEENLNNHEKVFEQATVNQDLLEEVYDRAAANKAAFDGLRSKIEMQKEQIERLWAHIEAQQELCFDLINEKLTEINVTSPTGIVQIKDLTGINIAKKFWVKLIKKIN